MTVLSNSDIISVLAAVASDAALENRVSHPEDIAIAMTMAIESGARVIERMRDEGLIDWNRNV